MPMPQPKSVAPSPAPWMMPTTLIASLGEDIPSLNAGGPTPINRVFRVPPVDPPIPDPVPNKYCVSYATNQGLKDDIQAGKYAHLSGTATVFLDMEGWDYSTQWSRNHAGKTFNKFVGFARNAGLKAGLASGKHWSLIAAAIDADVMLAQVQSFITPDSYIKHLSQLTNLIHQRPGESLIAELSAGQMTTQQMFDCWNAARPGGVTTVGYCGGFAVWGASTDQVESVRDFLYMVADAEG